MLWRAYIQNDREVRQLGTIDTDSHEVALLWAQQIADSLDLRAGAVSVTCGTLPQPKKRAEVLRLAELDREALDYWQSSNPLDRKGAA